MRLTWLGLAVVAACGDRARPPRAPMFAPAGAAATPAPCEAVPESGSTPAPMSPPGPVVDVVRMLPAPESFPHAAPIDLGRISTRWETRSSEPPEAMPAYDIAPLEVPADVIHPPPSLAADWSARTASATALRVSLSTAARNSALAARCAATASSDRCACWTQAAARAEASAERARRERAQASERLLKKLSKPDAATNADVRMMHAMVLEERARADGTPQALAAAERAFEAVPDRAGSDAPLDFWAGYRGLHLALARADAGAARRAGDALLRTTVAPEVHVEVRLHLATSMHQRGDAGASAALQAVAEAALDPSWKNAPTIVALARVAWAESVYEAGRYAEAVRIVAPLERVDAPSFVRELGPPLIAPALFRLGRGATPIAEVSEEAFASIAMDVAERAASHFDLSGAEAAVRSVIQNAPDALEAPRALASLRRIEHARNESASAVSVLPDGLWEQRVRARNPAVTDAEIAAARSAPAIALPSSSESPREQALQRLNAVFARCAGGAAASVLEIEPSGRVTLSGGAAVSDEFRRCLQEQAPLFFRGFTAPVRAELAIDGFGTRAGPVDPRP